MSRVVQAFYLPEVLYWHVVWSSEVTHSIRTSLEHWIGPSPERQTARTRDIRPAFTAAGSDSLGREQNQRRRQDETNTWLGGVVTDLGEVSVRHLHPFTSQRARFVMITIT